MKTLLPFLILLIPISHFSQSVAIEEFYANHGFHDNTVKIRIGGALIKMGSWFIEEPATRSLVKKARSARILVNDAAHAIDRRELDHLTREIRRDGYESLALVRDGLDKVEIYIREDRGYIRNLLLILNSDDEFVMASLDCRFTMDDIQAALDEEL
ncbi:MAG: DUF4252 domain-containing protein [Saprospiraceae bacterium]|nr:DUF4252 domain-containing protein [Saprospiraceae bacterium]